jgi:hypothetical protein
LLLAAAGLVAVVGAAGRFVARGSEPDRIAAPGADLRGALRIPDDGRPHLVLLLDPGCAACRTAREDLPDLRRLEAGGVGVTAVEAADRPGLRLGPGLFPVYALVGPEGELLALRRGWSPPDVVLAWVQARLFASP